MSNIIYPAFPEFVNFCQSIGYSQAEAKDLYGQLNAINWMGRNGHPIYDWQKFVSSMKKRGRKLETGRITDLPGWYAQTDDYEDEAGKAELLAEIERLRKEQNERYKNRNTENLDLLDDLDAKPWETNPYWPFPENMSLKDYTMGTNGSNLSGGEKNE